MFELVLLHDVVVGDDVVEVVSAVVVVVDFRVEFLLHSLSYGTH